jgi:hypothetical protein
MKIFKFTIERWIFKTNLEYAGWVEVKILELDYGTTYVIVSFCNWVKANYKGARTTINIDSHWWISLKCSHFWKIYFIHTWCKYSFMITLVKQVGRWFWKMNPEGGIWKMQRTKG